MEFYLLHLNLLTVPRGDQPKHTAWPACHQTRQPVQIHMQLGIGINLPSKRWSKVHTFAFWSNLGLEGNISGPKQALIPSIPQLSPTSHCSRAPWNWIAMLLHKQKAFFCGRLEDFPTEVNESQLRVLLLAHLSNAYLWTCKCARGFLSCTSPGIHQLFSENSTSCPEKSLASENFTESNFCF